MSFVAQTPQRRVPGAFQQTPAPNRTQVSAPTQASSFRSVSYPSLPKDFARASEPVQAQSVASPAPAAAENLKPLQRAAATINETLDHEKRYPELDSYVGRALRPIEPRGGGSLLMRLQRASPRNIIYRPLQHGRLSRRLRPTISPRGS